MTKTVLDKVEQEKRRVALSSVIAAVFLTTMKIVVGLLTHSLGILAEASHSGLDLIAAGVTYLRSVPQDVLLMLNIIMATVK